MPAIKSLTISYDALNEEGTFSNGDAICGKVTLVLLKETSVQYLFIKAKGDADVRWTEKRGDRSHTYTAHRRYFKLKEFLIPEAPKETVVPQGSHVYPFRFNIPAGSMPPSFRGNHGKIVYKLEAALSRSWRVDHTVEAVINVVSRSFPTLHSPMSYQVGSTRKEMGLFSKGHANMDVTIDRRAYAPGETVWIVAKIDNSSSKEMIPKFSLIQDVSYRTSSNTKFENHVINKVVDKTIKPHTQMEVKCAVKIPHGQMQTIQNCEIISVEYYIKAYLDISFAFDPEVRLPVVILPPGPQPASEQYPAGAIHGPRNSDFPSQVLSANPYAASPYHAYPGAQSYSTPQHAYPGNAHMYAPPVVYPPQMPQTGSSNPMPHLDPVYGSPFSSSSAMTHPPPAVPTLHPPPSAPESFNPPPTAPTRNPLPSAPAMDMDFLSQSDEPPPAYSLLFPTSENSDTK